MRPRRKSIKWKPLGRQKKVLLRQNSKFLERQVKFLEARMDKRYRYTNYMRNKFLTEYLSIGRIAHHKKFHLKKLINQLAFRLYHDKLVRTYNQGVHYIKLGLVQVDGRVVKNEKFLVKPGSSIDLDITSLDIHSSNILVPCPRIHTRPMELHNVNLVPRVFGNTNTNEIIDSVQH